MSRMIAEVYRAFKAANVPDDAAEAAARAVAEAGEGYVTNETLRAELATLRADVEREIAALRADMEREISALRGEIGSLRGDMERQIDGLRSEVQALRAEIRREVQTQLMALEERINRKMCMMFGALANLITIYEFIGR